MEKNGIGENAVFVSLFRCVALLSQFCWSFECWLHFWDCRF